MRQNALPALTVLLLLAAFSLAQNSNANRRPSTADQMIKQILDLPAPTQNIRPPVARDASPTRPAEFYEFKNIPPDDAPIEDLLDYWRSSYNQPNETSRIDRQPSIPVAERILEYCSTHPEKLNEYLRILPVAPEIASSVKAIYDQTSTRELLERPYMMVQVKMWLTHNTTYFINDLLREVGRVKDENNYVSNENQFALRSLARVDWDSALPIVERLESDAGQPYSQTLAKWVRYQYAVSSGDESDIERYRRALQQIVENRDAPWAQRDLAMDSLVAVGDWKGRDAWYLSLFDDPTLLTIQENGYTGLSTMMTASPPDKFTDQMLKLLRSGSVTARSGAARNLITDFNGDTKVLSELLPWLTDPAWAKSSRNNERGAFIGQLGRFSIPESIPGLISVVMNEPEQRSIAAAALESYKDPRANSAFRFALAQEDTREGRAPLISGLAACGGFSDDEQLSALEAYVTLISTEEGQEKYSKFANQYTQGYGEDEGDDEGEMSIAPEPGKPGAPPEEKEDVLPLPISIGAFVAEQTEPSEGVVIRAIDRLNTLRATNPVVADMLAEVMQKWKGRAIYIELLRRLKSGEAGIGDILRILADRSDIRKKVPNEVGLLLGSGGITRGIGACILEDPLQYTDILGKDDVEAAAALLGCARELRATLPLQTVAGFLSSKNALLPLAAERYLEMDDSVEARTMVLARHAGEARVLGARVSFVPDGAKNFTISGELNELHQSVNGLPVSSKDLSAMEKFEVGLRDEIRKDPNLVAVFALVNDAKDGSKVIRVFTNKIELTYYEDDARYWTKNLDQKEYENFVRFVTSSGVDRLSGLSSICYGCPSTEFIMFTKEGGRRVYFPTAIWAQAGIAGMEKVAKLNSNFDDLRKGTSELHYRFAENLNGLEVLWTNPKQRASAVWKKGADLRFLVEDEDVRASILSELSRKERDDMIAVASDDVTEEKRREIYEQQQKRRTTSSQSHYSWRRLDGQSISQPPEAAYLYDPAQLSQLGSIDPSPRAWQVRSGGSEIRTSKEYSEEPGLFRVSSSGQATRIRDGAYMTPIVTGDGRWAIVTKLPEGDENNQTTVVRVDLNTRRELKIGIAPAEDVHAVAFIASLNKVLVYSGPVKERRSAYSQTYEDHDRESAKGNDAPRAAEYFLVDPVNGAAQLVKGEFEPLEQQTYRPLQSTATIGEFWAAIHDEKTNSTRIGRYSDRTFSFKPLLTLASIRLDSMDIWVDEAYGKLYFTYNGHLLRLPLIQQK